MSGIKSLNNTQAFLSIGYVYLIVMGVLNETLYYQQIGIDILNYSSILDVLISPISNLTSSITSMVIVILLILFVMRAPRFFAKRKDKAWFTKAFKLEEDLDVKGVEQALLKKFSFMLALALFGFYIGTGLGGGFKTADKIKKGKITYEDKLTFINGDSDAIHILGTNSAYVFYLLENNKSVQITPISGVVQRIEDNKK